MTEDKKAAAAAEKEEVASSEENAAQSENYLAGFDFSKLEVSLEEMFRAGVHFGHHKSRKNPKMEEYIFGTRNSISIIDLQKTSEKLAKATDFLINLVSQNQEVLFVGTKKQVKKIVEVAAKACEMPYVTERWLGGTFTNFPIISGRTKYLRDEEAKLELGEYEKYTKYEQMKKAEELAKLEGKMGGIKNMKKLPGAIIITGVIEDTLAIKEAVKMKIPIVGFVDTNVNPGEIDYPVPANEDAVSSLKLIMAYITKAILEGKKNVKVVEAPVSVEAK